MTLPKGTIVPAEPATPPIVPAPAPAAPEVPAAPAAPAAVATTPVEQLQALTIEQLRTQLADKDTAIVSIGDEKTRLQNEQLLTVAERDRLMGELSTAITDRTAIDTELQKRELELGSQLETQTAATQTANQTATDAQAQLLEEKGKRVKAEIILAEFPELAAYAEVIQASDDPEKIRAACKVIKAANEKALTTQRQVLATGAPGTIPGTPPRAETVVDTDKIDAYLREGMKLGMAEYEKRRKLVLDQLAGAHPQ